MPTFPRNTPETMEPIPPAEPAMPPAPGKTEPAGLSEAACGKVLAMPARWAMIRALSRETVLPARELARVGKCTPQMATKHLALLRKHGVAVRRFGRLYALAPRFMPPPGAKELDLGPCRIGL